MRRLLLFFPALALILWSCDPKQYDSYDSARLFHTWAVVNDSKTFGEYDSLYYLVNPITNVFDSIYYNGNYTDSYYHSDSTRVMLRYTTQDSIYFHFDRMYAVLVNPAHMVMTIKVESDSFPQHCILHLEKAGGSDKVYRCGPDSLFKHMLETGHILQITATNDSTSSQPQGSQTYECRIPTAGFKDAFHLAESLNNPPLKKDSIANEDSLKTHRPEGNKSETHKLQKETHSKEKTHHKLRL